MYVAVLAPLVGVVQAAETQESLQAIAQRALKLMVVLTGRHLEQIAGL